jgi:CRP/FNR family cyclic AMP-dependent transcriptional regulator
MSAFGFLKPHELPVRLQRLKSLSLFSTLTPRELQIIDGLLHLREYQADEIIFDEGEEGQALYIVLSGVVSVCRNQAASRETLAELAAGSFFGDLALLDNTPRMAQVRARTDCELAVFFRADFMALLETDATIGYKISLQLAQTLAERLRRVMASLQRVEAL